MDPHSAWIRNAMERHETTLVRCATRLLRGDVERARDVVQDVFLRLCEAPRDQVEGHVEAWLFTVCRNRAIDVGRKEGRMEPLERTKNQVLFGLPASPDAGPGELTARRERVERLGQLMETLPPDESRALRLKLKEHKTYREISEEMGTSLGRVSKLVAGALGRLQAQLAEETDRLQEVRP